MDELPPAEALAKRHRLEQRELQARVTQKKKNATKKTRKGINNECAALEMDLQERHAAEVTALLDPHNEVEGSGSIDKNLVELRPASDDESSIKTTDPADRLTSTAKNQVLIDLPQKKKANRQKARLARRAADQAAAAAQAEAEAADVPDRRAEERKVMAREIDSRNLVEQEVRSDGHCLYAAIADQIQNRNVQVDEPRRKDYKVVRHDAANFIQKHADDFYAFLEEPLDSYVNKIRDTGEWGGQLEMLALARHYGIVINVLQGDGRIEKIEPDRQGPLEEIWLAYYRHSFGLGEHYNSLRTKYD